MKHEDKEILVCDICSRLPHGLKIEVYVKDKDIKSVDCVKYDTVGTYIRLIDEENFSIHPYLRPMSDMTEEEMKEFEKIKLSYHFDEDGYVLFDWFNKHHFDYRGLIEKGLALKAPEGMYN